MTMRSFSGCSPSGTDVTALASAGLAGEAAQRRLGLRWLFAWWQRGENVCGGSSDDRHSSLEHFFGVRRRLLHSTYLADVLAGSRFDFFGRGARFEASEGRDVAAHAANLRCVG